MELKALSLDTFREFLTNDNRLDIEDAYEDVGWFRRGIDIRAETTRAFPYDVMQGGKVLFTEDILQSQKDGSLQVVDIPPEIDIFDMLDNIVVDLDLHGAFYAIWETNRFNRNGRWRRLHPSSIRPQYDETHGLTGFKRKLKHKEIELSVDELLYVWMPNIKTEIGHGVGVGHSALMAATSLNNISKFQSAFFENGALNPTIISIEGYDKLPETEQNRIIEVFRRFMKGLQNAFRILPVSGNTSATNLMQPLREMAMEEMTRNQRETIATALGVPHSLLFSNASNFATATQDDLNFYDKTIAPLVVMIEQQLNERLFKPNGYLLRFQKSRLEVYQQLESSKVDRLSTMLRDKVITKDEYRAMLGLPPMADDDKDDISEQEQLEKERMERLQQPNAENEQPGAAADEQQANELRQWRKMATKRYKEGKPEKALAFESEYIPPTLSDSIARVLRTVDTVDSVHTVFDDAELWINPHGLVT